MLLKLMSLEVNLRRKGNKLLVQTFSLQTQEMIFLEMLLERIIIEIILRLATSSITDKASLVSISAMNIKFVFTIESLIAE
jgi:hypothetical protein